MKVLIELTGDQLAISTSLPAGPALGLLQLAMHQIARDAMGPSVKLPIGAVDGATAPVAATRLQGRKVDAV